MDVQTLGADWIVASSHKMCGPTGIGFLWGRYELLEAMPPWMGGGEMIQEVRLEGSTYAEPPSRFEAGTPAIAEAIGLGAACDYLSGLGMERVAAHERELGAYLYEQVGRQAAVCGQARTCTPPYPSALPAQLRSINRVRIYGPSPEAPLGRAALATFNVEGLHPTDISTILDNVRLGTACPQRCAAILPLLALLQLLTCTSAVMPLCAGRRGCAVRPPVHAASAPPPGHRQLGARVALHLQLAGRGGRFRGGLGGFDKVLFGRQHVTRVAKPWQACLFRAQCGCRLVMHASRPRHSCATLSFSRSLPHALGSRLSSVARCNQQCVSGRFVSG